MPELNAFWTIIGILVLMLGPAGAAWVGANGRIKSVERAVNSLKESVQEDAQDLRDWLKSLESRTRETDAQLRELRAVQTDRDRRNITLKGEDQ